MKKKKEKGLQDPEIWVSLHPIFFILSSLLLCTMKAHHFYSIIHFPCWYYLCFSQLAHIYPCFISFEFFISRLSLIHFSIFPIFFPLFPSFFLLFFFYFIDILNSSFLPLLLSSFFFFSTPISLMFLSSLFLFLFLFVQLNIMRSWWPL